MWHGQHLKPLAVWGSNPQERSGVQVQYALHNPSITCLDNATSRKGLDARQAAFANKQYKSHRKVGLPSEITQSLGAQDG